jgi:exopolysaccharide biosynthesis polyprenyl glycosylphosphotransferase
MFKLEKVFQNDDSAYILFATIVKTLVIILSYYIFSILEKDTIYDLFNSNIYTQSKYFYFSLSISFFYFFISLFNKKDSNFKRNFISFLKEDIFIVIISKVIVFTLFFIIKKKFIINIYYLYSLIFLFFNLVLLKLFFNNLYDNLIKKNIIQKNVMIVGNYDDIKKLLVNKFEQIYVFKCCIILDIHKYDQSLIKSEIKFPIFSNNDDIRSILEYHALGQVWLLDSKEIKTEDSLLKILKFSVDILIIDLETNYELSGKKLLADKFDFKFYEISRFHGASLFIKVVLDKIFSILFLILSSPLIILAMILIYLEDGFPLFFTQNRTGWDGRRFKIYKLRTLKKESFDKTIQVQDGDTRVLKFGKIIRRYSVDELPQFYNVLIGDMSIVGPRPHMVEHDIKYAALFGNFLKRHKCNPGLTGWAQVNGLRGATPKPEVMRRRMEFDLWYLNNWTIWLDVYIIFKTFYALIKYKGD